MVGSRLSPGLRLEASRALDKGVHYLLVAGVLEIDRQLVVLDRAHGAVAEFLVEHAVADGKAADLADFLAARRRAAAFDQERRPPCIARIARVFPRGPPAGRRPAIASRCGTPRTSGRVQPHLGHHFDLRGRQLVDEARARAALPLAVDAPVGGKRDEDLPARPGQPDIGEAPLLFETLEAVFLDRALAREQPLL